MAKKIRTEESDRNGAAISPWLKLVINLLIAFHVTAMFTAPMGSIAGGSPFLDTVADVLRPYTVAAFLNHGYAFFAPDPGPNHLVDYKIEFNDGRPPKE